jgi:hypothetical protein
MENKDSNTKSSTAKPVSIVGIYLTELDLVMAKIKLSDGAFLNKPIGKLSDLLSEEFSNVPRDLDGWRFIPCCE